VLVGLHIKVTHFPILKSFFCSPQSKIAKVNLRVGSHPWYFDDYGDSFGFEHVVEALAIWGEYSEGSFDIDEDYIILPSSLQNPTSEFDMEPSGGYDDEVGGAQTPSLYSEDDDNDDEAETDEQTLKNQPPFPLRLAGLELGSIVRRIREGDVDVKTDPEKKKQLDKIRFDWGDEELFLDIPFEKAMCALFAYYQIRGDLFVYQDFVMPGDDPWPRILEDYPIGEIVFRLREQQLWFEEHFPEKKSMLDMLDFVWFPRYESKLSDFEEEHMLRFGSPQPSIETLENMFPHPEDYWDDSNPPTFNFTLAEELIDQQIDRLESGAAAEEWDDEVELEEAAEEQETETVRLQGQFSLLFLLISAWKNLIHISIVFCCRRLKWKLNGSMTTRSLKMVPWMSLKMPSRMNTVMTTTAMPWEAGVNPRLQSMATKTWMQLQ
jgi:hypothetical protein